MLRYNSHNIKMFIRGVKLTKDGIKTFTIEVNKSNYYLVKYKLIYERDKIIKKLKRLKKEGLIKSINRPRSKSYKINKQLKKLITAKQIIRDSIKQFNDKVSTAI